MYPDWIKVTATHHGISLLGGVLVVQCKMATWSNLVGSPSVAWGSGSMSVMRWPFLDGVDLCSGKCLWERVMWLCWKKPEFVCKIRRSQPYIHTQYGLWYQSSWWGSDVFPTLAFPQVIPPCSPSPSWGPHSWSFSKIYIVVSLKK